MASEEQANEARRRHGQSLMKKGAHAIGVEEGANYGKKGFVVVAYVAPKEKTSIPSSIATEDGEASVPVVVTRSEPFKPE